MCPGCSVGTYQPLSGQTQCLSCDRGKFQALTGQANCTNCSAGRYQAGAGQTSCISCEIGKLQPAAGQPACLSCDAGKFQALSGQTNCTNCSAGTSQPGTGQSSCLGCDNGKYQPLRGQAACVGCESGKYQPWTGQTNCSLCRVGAFQPLQGQSSCLRCWAGGYQNATGGSACLNCTACPGGKYMSVGCDGSRDGQCSVCSVCGSWESLYQPCSARADSLCSNATVCPVPPSPSLLPWMVDGSVQLGALKCSPGQYLGGLLASTPPLATCYDCPLPLIGRNGVYCVPCAPMQAPYSDQTSCVCAAPSVMNATGDCVCPPGYSSLPAPNYGCAPCPDNTQWLDGACVACPPGQYANATSKGCQDCPAGRARGQGQAECGRCGNGSFAVNGTSLGSCRPCNASLAPGITSCPPGFRTQACPDNPGWQFELCVACGGLPDNAVWADECVYACGAGYYHEAGGCRACMADECPAGFVRSECTTYADANCDEECVNASKPSLFSEWTRGCEWGCAQGYALSVTDYWMFKLYECQAGA